MNKNILTVVMIGALVVLAGLGGYFNSRINSSSGVKEFDFVLRGKAYIPDTVRVKLGDTVVFNIDNQDNESHGLHLQQFGVAETIPALRKTSVKFTATSAGTVATTCA